MAGLNTVVETALRALRMNQQGLAVSSHNIANESTPGHSKQRLVVQPAAPEGDALNIGTGVRAVSVEALRDRLLEARLLQENSAKFGEEALSEGLRDIEVFFNDTADTGMLPAITRFFNSFHSLSLDPASSNAREEVLIAAGDLARSFKVRSDELKRLQDFADDGVSNHLEKLNSLASQIARLNTQIRTSEAGGQNANDLRDQRGELVKRVSEIVDVREIESTGNYQLYIAGTGAIVSNADTTPVTKETSGTTGFVTLKLGSLDLGATATGGQLYGQLQLRDTKIPSYLSKLDQLAYDITQQVNLIHSVSYDRGGNTGVNFFTALGAAAGAANAMAIDPAVLADNSKIATAQNAAGTDNIAATNLGNLIYTKVFSGGSVTDQYRSLVFTVGNDTNNAEGRLNEHRALLHQLENRRDSISGVSVDEESLKIIQFQRAYQAAASVVRAVDELFQSVMSIAR